MNYAAPWSENVKKLKKLSQHNIANYIAIRVASIPVITANCAVVGI